jgi:DNA-binding MarR family transcriptional regulator/GNAT superfamily N-acetyltransferase
MILDRVNYLVDTPPQEALPMPMAAARPPAADRVRAVRAFNRFYTRVIGVLDEGLLDSPFSLTEVRVLYELAHRTRPTASLVARELALDAGYLSRILRRFVKAGLARTQPSDEDARQSLLLLTPKGRRTLAQLEARSDREVVALLQRLQGTGQRQLLQAMDAIERLLGAAPPAAAPFVLRPPEPGDYGWIVHRHGALYASEYGYSAEFEGLVATIVGEFARHHDPARERCWIAERHHELVGSIFCVRGSDEVAKLRLLLVEPSARGLGIGARLIEECVRFARSHGYATLTLWTQSDLHAARHLYERAGFVRVASEPHHSFGRDLVAETWNLSLR